MEASETTAKPPNTPQDKKLSNAELKKRAKAEKQARREREKTGTSGGDAPTANGAPTGAHATGKKTEGRPPPKHGAPTPTTTASQRRASMGSAGGKQNVALRGKTGHVTLMDAKKKKDNQVRSKAKEKQVGLLGHLYGQPRRFTVEGAPKEVHPAVLATGLQMSSYQICGSNARCVAMLLSFKKVIEAYKTPQHTSLARHLTSHHLSPQIDYLKSCRPLSVSMGNAIRHLKSAIIKIDPAVPEHLAKESLLETIDAYIRERVTAAGEFIAPSAAEKISDGDVILTYANSSIVRKTLIRAFTDEKKGKKFRVVVVDSSPLFEGKRMASALMDVGIPVTYCLVTAASHAAKEATTCLLGAHAMLGNGRLYARVGTAIVAMHAHEHDVPVIVCCESYKFTDRVQLDSFVGNEIAPAEELLGPELAKVPEFQPSHEKKETSTGKEKGGKSAQAKDTAIEGPATGRKGLLEKWTDTPNLQLLNLMYDVTPAEYIKMVVTEHGSLPPSSVPVVHRISTDKEQEQ